MHSLDNFINIYPDDGASDEGPGHWGRAGASLFDNLELLGSATTGMVDLYRSPLVRNMGQYIHRVYIKDEYFVPMGDAWRSSSRMPSWYISTGSGSAIR